MRVVYSLSTITPLEAVNTALVALRGGGNEFNFRCSCTVVQNVSPVAHKSNPASLPRNHGYEDAGITSFAESPKSKVQEECRMQSVALTKADF